VLRRLNKIFEDKNVTNQSETNLGESSVVLVFCCTEQNIGSSEK